MAVNDIHIDTAPERVFAVLADWRSYGDWVVGSRFMRGADPGFPAAGTRFHHQVGVGPLHINDHTKVLEVHQPDKLVLRAKARPLGTAIVDITIEPEGEGSKVTIREDPGDLWDEDVHQLLARISRRHTWMHTEKLQEFDGELGFTRDQGEN